MRNQEITFKANSTNGSPPPRSEGGIILTSTDESAPSVFNIESLVLKANMISRYDTIDFPDNSNEQVQRDRLAQLVQQIELIQMQRIGGETLEIGNTLLWRLKTLLALAMQSEGQHADAISTLEQVIEMQARCFPGRVHSSFEYTYNQLQLACTRAKEYERAMDVIGELIDLRVKIYGEASESILNPKLSLASIQNLLGHSIESMETCDSGLETCDLILEDESLTKEQVTNTSRMKGEFLQTLYNHYLGLKQHDKMNEMAD